MSAQDNLTPVLIILFVFQLLMFGPMILIGKLGGPKIAFYRVWHISWMSIGIIDHDGSRKWTPVKQSSILTMSPPHINFAGKIRYIDPTNFTRRYGAPAQEWHIDNALPIPIIRGFRDTILDPLTVNKAYNTDILRRFYNLTREANKKVGSKVGTYMLMMLGVILAVVAAVWLAVRFGL